MEFTLSNSFCTSDRERPMCDVKNGAAPAAPAAVETEDLSQKEEYEYNKGT